MNKHNSILATIITALGSVVVALISNIDKVSLLSIPNIWPYIIFTFIIVCGIWIINIQTERKKEKRISDHAIFTQFIYWERFLNKNFELINRGRHLVFKEILEKYFEVFKEKLLEMHANTRNIHNQVEFKNKHICILYEIIDAAEKKFDSSNYSEEDFKTLSIVLPIFNKWAKKSYDVVEKRIVEICESELFENNISKNIVILVAYQIALSLIILNASKALSSLNGQLQNLKFKGEIIT